jgi:hypothetical protein
MRLIAVKILSRAERSPTATARRTNCRYCAVQALCFACGVNK